MTAEGKSENPVRTPTFGGMLRSRRVKAQLTQKDLASALGACPPLISQYESGRRLPSIRMFAKLRTVLGLSNDESAFLLEIVEQTT